MRKLYRTAFITLLVGGLALGAQTAAAGGQPATPAVLLEQARAGMAAVPPAVAPYYLAQIAQANPAATLADWKTAFQAAHDLAPAAIGDAVSDLREQQRAAVELMAVTALVRSNQMDDAIALARAANARRAPLYDVIISTIASDPRASAARMRALLHECQDADGSYPYRAVGAMLHSSAYDADARQELLETAYQVASVEADPIAIVEAMQSIFVAGHTSLPVSDPKLADCIIAILNRLAGAQDATSRATVTRLLSILGRVDAKRAQEFIAQHPLANKPAGPITSFTPEPVDIPRPANAAAARQLLDQAAQLAAAVAAQLQTGTPAQQAAAERQLVTGFAPAALFAAAAAADYPDAARRALASPDAALRPLLLAAVAGASAPQ